MKHLIRSPLQFVRPMTELEWAEMMRRAANRERRRKRGQHAKRNAGSLALVKRRLALIRAVQATDSSGTF